MADFGDFRDDDDDYSPQSRGLSFDDMVSFTMFAEMTIVLLTCAIFLVILYYTY